MHRLVGPAPCVTYSGEHKGVQVRLLRVGTVPVPSFLCCGLHDAVHHPTKHASSPMACMAPLRVVQVHVVWNGKCATTGVDNVGTVPASLSTYLALQAFQPDLVISAGTAGGFKSQVCWWRASRPYLHGAGQGRPPSDAAARQRPSVHLRLRNTLPMTCRAPLSATCSWGQPSLTTTDAFRCPTLTSTVSATLYASQRRTCR
jgi:hypothetical protein